MSAQIIAKSNVAGGRVIDPILEDKDEEDGDDETSD